MSTLPRILDINPQAVIASIDPTPSGRFAHVQFTHAVLLPYAYMNKTHKYAYPVLQIRVPMRLAATVGEGEVVRLWVNENYMPRFVPEQAYSENSVQEVAHA